MSQSPPLSQSDLDEIVSKKYLNQSLTPGSLSTRLQTIAGILPRINQEDDDQIEQLEPLIIELGKPWLLNKRNKAIRILLACIHSDVLRIYAPEQPYSSDKILGEIFNIIISALDGIQDPDEDDYDFHFRVLESLSTVQSYIVMNDLEDEQLLMSLTKQLFKITKEKTIKLALTHITDILCGIINDIQVIPEIFLQFILERLIEPFRSQNPTEYDLATTVIRRCINDLKIAIEEYITNIITNFDDLIEIKDDDNKKKKKLISERRNSYKCKLQIITELASISIDFIENSLLTLEECLQNEDLQIRLLFVDMFASIFTQSSPSLSRQSTSIFKVFLKRYDDVSIEIREFMANITCLLFEKQHNFRKEIQDYCIKRIEDINEVIRGDIIKQVCIASIQSSSNSPYSIISIPLFRGLLKRTMDKKQSVRFIAIQYAAKLFGAHLRPYWRNNKSLPSEMRALLPIPKKLISILNTIDFITKLHLEIIFDQEMIGNQQFIKINNNKKQINIKQQIEERMNVTLGIIALLSDESKKLFQKYFMREKYQLQALINKILTIYNELRMAKSNKNIEINDDDDDDDDVDIDDDDDDDDQDIDIQDNNDKNKNNNNNTNIAALQRQYDINISNFNQRFPIYGQYRHISSTSGSPNTGKSKTGLKQKQKPGDYLKQLIESQNGKIRHYLQNLCLPSTKLKSTYNCCTNLQSFVHSMSSKNTKKSETIKLNEFTSSLCTRLSNVLFSYDAIPILLTKLVDIVEKSGGQPRALLTSGIFLLNCLCDEIPNIFDHHQCLKELIKLFNFPKTTSISAIDITKKLSFVSLRILAKSITPNSFDDDDPSQQFLSDLTEKAKISSSYQEAQLATECLIRCTGKYSQIVKQLCNESSKELDITEQYLSTLLSTLSIIAKLSPNIFILRASHITQFILETLLPYDLNNNDNHGIYKENNINDDDEEEEEEEEDEDENDENEEENDQDIDIEQGKKRRNGRGRGRGRGRTKKTKKTKKTTKRGKKKSIKRTKKAKKRKIEESSSMSPTLLTSKQCGIQILVNYLLSIVDLPKDQLGIASVGISPIKSSPSSKRSSPSRTPKSKRKRNRNKNNIDIDLGDVIMDDVVDQNEDDDDDDVDVDVDVDDDEDDDARNDDDVEMMEESDPFSRDSHNVLQQPISPEIECDRILDALFDLIRKYGQINPDEIEQEHSINYTQKTTRKYSRGIDENDNEKLKKSKKLQRRKKKGITAEEVSLVNMAVDGILAIICRPRYRRLLGLLRFYELGFLIHHRNANIRKHTLQSFWNKLRDHKLPSHYASILPLIATDPNKRVRDAYRPAVQRFFDRMRKENQIRTSSGSSIISSAIEISKLPEYLLFYVVHLLSHHPDFDEKKAKQELKQSSYKQSTSKSSAFVGWRGRRTDLSESDTSPSRMIKKKSKRNDDEKKDEQETETEIEQKESDKQEADNDDNDEDKENKEEKEEKEKKKISPNETSVFAYYGTIFDFYYDALLKGTNQFPLIIKILTRIDDSYDVFKPLSKGHRYLVRIAMNKLKKRYQNKKFADFPGRVPLPKAIFKLRESYQSTSGISTGYDEGKIDKSSPRRVDIRKSKRRSSINRRNKNLSSKLLLDADQSLLATTTSDSTIKHKSSIKRRKKGLFSSELLKKKYGNLDEEEEREKKDEENTGSDHPSDDDVINDVINDMPDLNISASGFDLSAIQKNLNESLIDNDNNNDNDKDKDKKKVISSGSGAEADDETNTVISPKPKRKAKKTKKIKNTGKKRKRDEIEDDDDSTDKNDKSDKDEPPKKKPKRRVTRRK